MIRRPAGLVRGISVVRTIVEEGQVRDVAGFKSSQQRDNALCRDVRGLPEVDDADRSALTLRKPGLQIRGYRAPVRRAGAPHLRAAECEHLVRAGAAHRTGRPPKARVVDVDRGPGKRRSSPYDIRL